jgi:uncharacterized Zn-binding protein involved in type VI secretion
MPSQVAILGTTSSHGGTVTSASGTHLLTAAGAVCVVGDLHSCPISGHGVTAILTGASNSISNGKALAIAGSVTGCGATLNGNFAPNITTA